MAVYVFPPSPVSLTPDAIKFKKDAVLTDVNEDSAVPANNDPLPAGSFFKENGSYVPVAQDDSVVANNKPLPSGAFFQKNGDFVPATEDTAVVANNKPLPNGMFIKKDDGNYYPVTLDTTNPYNHTPIPVAITDVTGTANVNITAGDLNVSIKHNGVDPSSVRIGDGTNIATVNSSNELKVIDTDTHTKLDTIHTDLTNINTRLGDQTQYTRISDGTNIASVTAANALKVDASATTQPAAIKGTPIPGNTTSTPLGIGATFTGTWFDLTDFNSVALGVYADQDSAANGLKYQFSSDGSTVHHEHSYTYLASSNGVGYNINAEFKYFRVVYTNNTVAQTSFSIMATAKQTALFPSSYKIVQTISDQTQALFTRSVIVGKSTAGGGTYENVKVSPSGAVQVGGTVGLDAGTNSIGSISNFPTTVDTNSGAAGANTLRSVLATRHEAAATPLSLRESDGTNFLSSIALAAAQLTSGALTAIKMGASVIMGWDGTTHRELAVTTGGAIRTSSVVKSGTITSVQKTVGSVGTTGAVRATVSGSAPATTRTKLWVKPSKNNTGAIYIGSASVTISTGMEIIGPDRWEILDDSNDWYLISDTDGQTVEIIEVA